MLLPEIRIAKDQQVEPTKRVQETEQIDPERAAWQLTVLRVIGLTKQFVSRPGGRLVRRKDFHIGKKHNTDTRGRSDEKVGSLRLRQDTADEASRQEIQVYFMEQAQAGKEYEVSLADPIQDQDKSASAARIVVYNSDSSQEKHVPNLRSFTPAETTSPTLTEKEGQFLANKGKRTR